MDTTRIERELRFLKAYAAIVTVVGIASCATMARSGGLVQGTTAKFDVINAERINIVEPDGKYRLVLSNRPRSIGPIYRMKPFGYEGGGRPGMLWFNDEGTENGGFGFTGSKCETGTSAVTKRPCKVGDYSASAHFTFDQFNQDQIFVMDYSEQNGQRRVGIQFNDRDNRDIYDVVKARDSILKQAGVDTAAKVAAVQRMMVGNDPNTPAAAERLWIGRDVTKNAILNMRDQFGKTRLRLVVDSLGSARIEFLDADGKVTNSLTGTR